MADNSPSVLRRFDRYEGSQILGDMWTLKQGKKALRCALTTHVLGWELRVTSGVTFPALTGLQDRGRSVRGQ